MRYNKLLLPLLVSIPLLAPVLLKGQPQQEERTLQNATLQQCIDYALKNQPEVRQSLIDEEIGERDINSALSGWLPQITGTGSYNYNIKQQTIAFGDQIVTTGQKHTSVLGGQATQQILNAGLIQASQSAKWYRLQYKQYTENSRIYTVVDVSKAFYDILTSNEQLTITNENIARLEKQLKDAYAQYEGGIVDKTDYKRAQISLSNANADKKRIVEMLKSKYANLKQLMGYPAEKTLDLSFDNTSMESAVLLDTTQQLNYQNRIEYRLLETQRKLQSLNTGYNKLSFLPTLSGFINYNFNYFNNDFGSLYDRYFPNSVTGLTLSLPIFTGTRRIQEIRKSQLQERRIDLDLENTKNQIFTQYETALASYKANLNDWKTAKQNVELSRDVYNTIKLQYNEGIKTYLELMTAETDLRTSQVNYLNALYSLLSSKLDVQQALGTITF
ncbi:outer membrane protein TolC [Arcticibacter tournemirensis]|uniref:TolC family protein n=1 Tax=Arcticibacter tournemirensis TaxID=699437 RepID=A0A5M9HHA4_9SPHI|nr:TolC family protein [Arcticibacter tournemirensis]KAA8485815.1 TolC family protein [Arcticibacter tournemirensis]TQM46939.1 outer membrane protein TolC [Arcticibacter tournemirensis]